MFISLAARFPSANFVDDKGGHEDWLFISSKTFLYGTFALPNFHLQKSKDYYNIVHCRIFVICISIVLNQENLRLPVN